MSHKQGLPLVIAVILVMSFLVGCGGSAPTAVSEAPTLEPPTPMPEPSTATPIPPTTTPIPPTAIPTQTPMSTIKTAVGDLVITEVQLTDRVPPDCNTSSPECNQATEGHQLLVVLLERAGGDPLDITDMVKLTPTSQEIYVIAGDDSRIDNAGIGLYGSLSYVVFSSPTSAQDFTLFWPDNSPIKLGK